MRPVDQDKFYVPGVSQGNCQQAATASILGLDLSEVPDFMASPSGFWPAFWKFVKSKGLYPVEFHGKDYSFPCHYLAYGPSERGVSHAVVYYDGKLAHDPHPSRSGILSLETVCLLVPIDLEPFIKGTSR